MYELTALLVGTVHKTGLLKKKVLESPQRVKRLYNCEDCEGYKRSATLDKGGRNVMFIDGSLA